MSDGDSVVEKNKAEKGDGEFPDGWGGAEGVAVLKPLLRR